MFFRYPYSLTQNGLMLDMLVVNTGFECKSVNNLATGVDSYIELNIAGVSTSYSATLSLKRLK